MSAILSVRQICEDALRKIGAYSIIDTGADPVQMEVAARWLDLNVGHLAGTRSLPFLNVGAVEFPITPGNGTITLNAAAATNWPKNGIQFINKATLKNAAGHEDPLTLLHRVEYDEIADKARPGMPEQVYIDRFNTMTAKLYPVPPSDVSGLKLVLSCTAFAENFSIDKLSLKEAERAVETIRTAWNKWLIISTAAEIGDGPVRKMPQDEVRDMRDHEGELRRELLAFEARPNSQKPPVTRYHDF